MTLEELIKKELPLNRKEKFYTGTVFPMIVCRDNFKYFHLFLSLLGINGLEIKANPNLSNIQFFTEYNLRESIYDPETKTRFGGQPETNDTPDILILIAGEQKILIAIEAKMYEMLERHKLEYQMNRQKKYVLKWLQTRLNIQRILHYALLPKALSDNKMNGLAYPIITWDDIYKKYKEAYTEDYFLSLLKIALNYYDELVSESTGYSKNCEIKMSGVDILKGYRAGTLDKKTMGRSMGLKGKYLLEDINSGRWRKQEYETSSKEKLPTDNWFYIKEFIELVDEIDN